MKYGAKCCRGNHLRRRELPVGKEPNNETLCGTGVFTGRAVIQYKAGPTPYRARAPLCKGVEGESDSPDKIEGAPGKSCSERGHHNLVALLELMFVFIKTERDGGG